MKKRVHVWYAGRVQGVGFRITAEETAHQLQVVGWIRNLRDGRVELIAEAEESILVRFLRIIRSGPMCNFIQREDVSWSEPINDFDDFEIRYF